MTSAVHLQCLYFREWLRLTTPCADEIGRQCHSGRWVVALFMIGRLSAGKVTGRPIVATEFAAGREAAVSVDSR